MPIINCPKCQGKLRFPDDQPARRVKCPTCGNIFLSSEGGASTATASKSEIPAARDSKDFELPMDDGRSRSRRADSDDDRDRGRRRRDEDEDDSNRGRNRRRDEEEDDDRGRRRRDEDDDSDRSRSRRRDEDDERDRGRRRRDDDDDDRRRRRREERDDYDDRPRDRRAQERAKEGQFNRASLACLLNFIGGWLNIGALGVLTLAIFLAWCGVHEGMSIFAVIAGLLGLGYWFTSATGFGFLVSGPRSRGALGLSIATASTAALNLILLFVIASSRNFGGFGGAAYARTAEIHWDSFVTQLTGIPNLLFAVIASSDASRAVEGSILPVLANLAEVAQMILFFLTLRAVMQSARDTQGAKTCMKAVLGYSIAAGGLIAVALIFGLLMLLVRPAQARPDFESINAIFYLYMIVPRLALAGLGVAMTLIVKSVKSRIDYRR